MLWRPLLVLFAFVAIVVVILILVFSGGGPEPYVTPEVPTPTSTLPPEELDPVAQPKNPDAEPVAGKDLEVGDCLTGATVTTARVTTFDKVDCDEPHDAEVFTIIELDESAKYPGTNFVSGKGRRGCRARLRRLLTRKAFRDRQLGYKYVYPTAQSWAQDDRDVTCLATFKKPRKTKLELRDDPAA